MLDWIREHFSVVPSCASFEYPAHFSLIGIHLTSWLEYTEVEFCFAGLYLAIGYWPNGKYDETDGAGA